jgi:polyhydroxybutyrate depolymerase
MKKRLFLLSTLLLALLTQGVIRKASAQSGDVLRTLNIGDLNRRYEFHRPSRIETTKALPVVIAFHGGGGNPQSMRKLSGLNSKADEAGFIVVYPYGTGRLESQFLTFNGGDCCGYAMENQIDDVSFVRALLDDLATVTRIDLRRVYATGLSNGGIIAYRVAAELADRIAAIAPVGGPLMMESIQPSRAVPVMHFHGTGDESAPFQGGYGKGFSGKGGVTDFKSVEFTLNQWIEANGCQKTPSVEPLPDKTNDGMTCTRKTWSGGRDGSEVVLIEIENGGHTWPGMEPPVAMLGQSTKDISANDLMWEFFQKHALPVPAGSEAKDQADYSPPSPSLEAAELRVDWQDAKRERQVPAKLYFPRTGNGPFPVIVFSHGLGGSREHYEYLARHWAGCGYVSVHLTHLGSDDSLWKDLPLAERGAALKRGAGNVKNALNRPPDIQFALDEIARMNVDEASPLKSRLDLSSMAVAGHSFGGYTALAVAGQTFMMPLMQTKRYDEPRIRAAIQMSAPAPTIRRELDAVYGSIRIPVMHMTGTRDFLEFLPQTTVEDRRIPFDHMNHAETFFVSFIDGDHFIFSGRNELPGATDRKEQDAIFHRLICASTTAFWDAYLKGNADAKKWLFEGGCKERLGAQADFECKAPATVGKAE